MPLVRKCGKIWLSLTLDRWKYNAARKEAILYRITKARIQTHIYFLRQQLLPDRASILRYTYSSCLFIIIFVHVKRENPRSNGYSHDIVFVQWQRRYVDICILTCSLYMLSVLCKTGVRCCNQHGTTYWPAQHHFAVKHRDRQLQNTFRSETFKKLWLL